MSAAATAAGYLYASGRLRGRESARAGASTKPEPAPEREGERTSAAQEQQVARRASCRDEQPAEPKRRATTPKIEYRTAALEARDERNAFVGGLFVGRSSRRPASARCSKRSTSIPARAST